MARNGSKKSRSRWRFRLFLCFLLVGMGVWFLPWLATRGPLRQPLLTWCLPQLDGQIQVEEVSASWFSPIEMQGVRVVDAQGTVVLAAKSVRSEDSLAAVILDSSHLGTFHVDEPTLHVVMREGGSNIEDVVRSLLEDSPADDLTTESPRDPPTSSPTTLPVVKLNIIRGTVVLHDPAGAKSEFRDVAVTITHDPAADQPLIFNSTGSIAQADASNPLVAFQFAGHVHPDTLASEMSIKTGAVALQAFEPLLSRFDSAATVRGELAADIKIQYDGSNSDPLLLIVGKVDGRKIHLRSNRFLAGDAIDLETLWLDVDWLVEDGELLIRRHECVSDVGTLKAEGRFDIHQILDGDLQGLLNNHTFTVDGRLEVARLANMLPTLLQVRDGTQLTDGQLTITASGSQIAGGRRWQGRIETSNLKGLAGGRAVAWREPVVGVWQATQKEDGALRGSASCTADFLDLKAEGTPVDATVSGTCDLNRLHEALSQFFDLGGLQLAGRLTTEFRLRQTDQAADPNLAASAQVHASGSLRFEDFVFRSAEGQVWQEPRMEIAIDANGRAGAFGVERVDDARLRVTTSSDDLQAKLLVAVSLAGVGPAAGDSSWPLDVEIRGAFDSWYPRLQRLGIELPFEVHRIRGGIDGRLRCRIAADEITLENADVELTQLDFQGGGYFVQEPRVVFKGDAVWSRVSSSLRSKTSTLQSSALAMRVENLEVVGGESGGSSATGKVVLAADLTRLQRWFHDPATPLPRQWAGAVAGQADLSHRGGVTMAEWEATINNAAVSQPPSPDMLPVRGVRSPANRPWQTIWSERVVSLSGVAKHHAAEHVLELARFDVSSDTLKLADTQGKIDLGDDPLHVDLAGNVVYDLQEITALLQPYLGPEVQLVGTGTRPFVIRGPLVFSDSTGDFSNESSQATGGFAKSLRKLIAQASLGWSSAQVYGLAIGRGELKGELRENVVTIAPLDLSVGQGRLLAKARVDLSGSAPKLIVEPGRVIENVRVSPELCESWLKFVAPLLADATRADGIFSLDLSRCQIPLADTSKADIKGVLAIQSAQVRPGPASEQLVAVAKQVEAIVKRQPFAAIGGGQPLAMNIPAQDLAFEVRDGRVYHQNFQLKVGDVVLRTSGSVGFDSSLEMVAEIPIQEQWVARDRYLKGLAGQVIRIPVRGTLKHPKLDRRALEDLTKQMVGSAAGSFLDDAVNRGLNEGLERLFGR